MLSFPVILDETQTLSHQYSHDFSDLMHLIMTQILSLSASSSDKVTTTTNTKNAKKPILQDKKFIQICKKWTHLNQFFKLDLIQENNIQYKSYIELIENYNEYIISFNIIANEIRLASCSTSENIARRTGRSVKDASNLLYLHFINKYCTSNS